MHAPSTSVRAPDAVSGDAHGAIAQRRRSLDSDRGAVTVEAAIALIGLVAVLAMGLAGVAAVGDQLRCTDAAREAARLAARGDPETARDAAERIAPSGAQLDMKLTATAISVTVRAEPAGGLLPGVEVSADAYAVPEPGVSPDDRSKHSHEPQ